jgi:hypothetical protein
MINAWSLLYDELYGDDEMTDKVYPVENTELNDDKIEINTGTGNTIFNVPEDVEIDEDIPEVVTVGEKTTDDDVITITGGDFVNFDLGVGNTSLENTSYGEYGETFHLDLGSYSDPFVSAEDVITFGGEDDFIMPPTPGIQKDCTRKYKEDESIKALQDYISTTYGGHYTSDNNNVQTLDLIESVGDAESFCRSNAIKYLSRYDKKGQAKRDILKALHYSLLLYHFSGQLNETTTRGYETF